MASFPKFYGQIWEGAMNFLSDVEVALLVIGMMPNLWVLPNLLKQEAKVAPRVEACTKATLEELEMAFLKRYGGSNNLEKFWPKLF